jgi:Bacteriophage tail assembly protein
MIKLSEYEQGIYEIPEFVLPSQWAEENFHLVKGYANPSKQFIPYRWQREPMDAITRYDTVILCGCVQFGKSLIAEVILWWLQATRPINSLCIYAKKETVEDVFQDRFRPSLYEVPALRSLWSGNPDDLTIKKFSLNNSIVRVGSARVRDDIASHPSGHIYLSELAKYRDCDFDVVKIARGRQEAYNRTGNKSAVFESSPLEVGDPLHREMYRPGVLNLEWFWPCPKCGHYQIYDLKQIKELPNEAKEFDHNPQRIRNDTAARYECVNCGNDVPESARAATNERGVWKTIDEVLSATGELVTKRKQTQTVSFRWNRLIDFSFKWSECLARFFEASRSGNPILLKDFLNEDMAEFWSLRAEERPTSWLIAKCARYTMKDESLPSGVLAIFVGIDTQDKGYYFVMRGYGSGKESWLLDCDYIPCEMGAEQNFEAVFQTVKKRIERRELFTADGRRLFINFGLIDRGGHKANYVDYIAGHLDGVFAYIGAKDRLHPLVKAGKDDIYFGNTENLARIVAADAELSNWHLPEDVPTDYLNQFVKQYEKEEVDRYGNTVKKWMKGGADHFRDCENYIQAALIISGVDEVLYNGEEVDAVRREQAQDARQQIENEERIKRGEALDEPKPIVNDFLAGIQSRWARGRGF